MTAIVINQRSKPKAPPQAASKNLQFDDVTEMPRSKGTKNKINDKIYAKLMLQTAFEGTKS